MVNQVSDQFWMISDLGSPEFRSQLLVFLGGLLLMFCFARVGLLVRAVAMIFPVTSDGGNKS